MDYEWHWHHKIPWPKNEKDSYNNLTLILSDLHKLVYTKDKGTIDKYLVFLDLVSTQLNRVNLLRSMLGNTEILIS